MIGATNKQRSIGCRVYDLHGKAKTLCSQAGGGGAKAGLYYVDGTVKNLRVSGAEKLQTLPVGYTKAVKPETGISLCGNGWTVDVIAHILKNIADSKHHDIKDAKHCPCCGHPIMVGQERCTYCLIYLWEVVSSEDRSD